MPACCQLCPILVQPPQVPRKGINIAGIACAVLIGTGAISGERETGTIEMLLTR